MPRHLLGFQPRLENQKMPLRVRNLYLVDANRAMVLSHWLTMNEAVSLVAGDTEQFVDHNLVVKN